MDTDHSKIFGKALCYLLEQKGRGATASIAIEAGITQSYLKSIKSGARMGSQQTLNKIAEALGTTYEEMLKLGQGIVLCEKAPTKKRLNVILGSLWKNEPGPPPINPTYFEYVPMAESRLSAEDGEILISEESGKLYAFRKDWLRKIASSIEDLVLISMEGDSMAPTITAGDTVMIDMGRTLIKSGGIYAMSASDAIVVKRMELLVDGNALVISDNRQEYPPYEAILNDIRVLGEVVWCAKQFLKLE